MMVSEAMATASRTRLRQGVVADIGGRVGGDAVALVPDDLAVVGGEADVQAGRTLFAALLLHKSAGGGVVEGVDDQVNILQEAANVVGRQPLADGLDLDTDTAENAVAQGFDLPQADLAFAVELRADVVLLDAVVVDYAHRGEALARKVVGQVGAEGAGPAECQSQLGEPGDLLPAAVDLLMMQFAGHLQLQRWVILLRGNAVEQTFVFALAQHADEAVKIEIRILAGETDSGALDRQIVLADDARVPLAIHVVVDAVDIAAVGEVPELRAA